MARERRTTDGIAEAGYAVVQDIAASWHDYAHIAATLSEPLPDGLILHAAGPTDEGFRIIAVWTSEEAWLDFHQRRIEPALAALRRPQSQQPAFRDLHTIHTVVGLLATGP
jgi:hypothetical protein